MKETLRNVLTYILCAEILEKIPLPPQDQGEKNDALRSLNMLYQIEMSKLSPGEQLDLFGKVIEARQELALRKVNNAQTARETLMSILKIKCINP